LKKVENYEQGSFCALGVLCDIYQKESEEPLAEERVSLKAKKTKVSIDGQFEALPDKVRDWAGLKTTEGMLRRRNKSNIWTSIPMLNDDEKLSFKAIADVIEKNFEEM